jgi:hypothetical protein
VEKHRSIVVRARHPRRKIGGKNVKSTPPHEGLCALVRHMARVAAERDYGQLLEHGVQPGRPGEDDHEKSSNLRKVLK